MERSFVGIRIKKCASAIYARGGWILCAMMHKHMTCAFIHILKHNLRLVNKFDQLIGLPEFNGILFEFKLWFIMVNVHVFCDIRTRWFHFLAIFRWFKLSRRNAPFLWVISFFSECIIHFLIRNIYLRFKEYGPFVVGFTDNFMGVLIFIEVLWIEFNSNIIWTKF